MSRLSVAEQRLCIMIWIMYFSFYFYNL